MPTSSPSLNRRLALIATSLALFIALSVVLIGDDIWAAIDGDNDGFSDAAEQHMGTNPLASCPSTPAADDESVDAMPPDFNDDQQVNISDVSRFRPKYGSFEGDSGFNSRFDLNTDSEAGVLDFAILRNYFGETCTPAPTATPSPSLSPKPSAQPTASPPLPTPGPDGWALLETFDGTPASPSQGLLPRTFDYVATHRTDPETPDGTDADGSYGDFPADHGANCSGPPNQHAATTSHRSNSENPDGSFYICNNHMMSSMGEVAGYSVSSFWPRQEFNFDDGGVLQFDVNINAPHDRQWWEVLIMPRDQLQAGAAKDWLPIDETYPEDRIVLEFQPRSTRRMEVGTGAVPPDGQIASESECGNPCWWGANHRHPGDPALTDRTIRRTHRIEIFDDHIIWGVEEEDGSFDTMTLEIPGGLPFTQGLVLFKTHAYTPEKADNDNIYTFHWDNIAFTGPILPMYDVFESPEVIGRMSSTGSTETQEIDVSYVGADLYLFGQVHHGLQGQVLLSINDGPAISVEPHTGADCRNGGWRSFMIPLEPSQLRIGINTFNWTVGPRPACAQGQWYPDGFSIKALEVQMTPGASAAASFSAPDSSPARFVAPLKGGAFDFLCSFDEAPEPAGGFRFARQPEDGDLIVLRLDG